jgi:predicted transcriptional regulator of viral defense system
MESLCLESALELHGLVPSGSDTVWMAIHRKARKPTTKGLRMNFVRFSGKALTQGVVNARIDGMPIRVYSAAKTITDCLSINAKLEIETAIQAFRTVRQLNKCSRERILHFASICRVGRPLRLMYSFHQGGAHPERLN